MSVIAVLGVCLATVVVGTLGIGTSRTTGDFYVASRQVSAAKNASAISGEYLSAASFLGVAGLIYQRGSDTLWVPVGYTAGYVVLLVLVAAPLRRSGAYTIPDFAEDRMQSRTIRRIASVLVVLIGWLYLLPLIQGAGLALRFVTGWPRGVGAVLVVAVVVSGVAAGGMRSITTVQALQYWFKLAAISVPAFVLLAFWWRDGALTPVTVPWSDPLAGTAAPSHATYTTYSTLLALCLGTMGLPHVLVRFYTNPDGRAARRTTAVVIALLGLFYLFPPIYAYLGRAYLQRLPDGVSTDSMMLYLPREIVSGVGGEALTAVLAGGAFAAFLATASGLVVSVAGVLDQDLLRPSIERLTAGDGGGVQGFRLAALLSVLVPLVVAVAAPPLSIPTTVNLAFALAASTFAPLLLFGVWWRGLSTTGAITGLVLGSGLAVGATAVRIILRPEGWWGALLEQPAAWSVTTAFAATALVSLATPRRIPPGTSRVLTRLHTPEALGLARWSR